MKVIFATNIPSPYRVDFFNELGKYCDLTVLYERKKSSERDDKWISEQAQNYTEIFLDLKPVGVDRSRGSALKNYIKNAKFDFLILTNYVSPAEMQAILFCRMKKIPYIIEYDGGFNKKDKFLKRQLKKLLLSHAMAHFTTSDQHISYLYSLGIQKTKIYKYPFTSIKNEDILTAECFMQKGQLYYREKLGIREKKVIISVGRFSYENGYGKGYDVLIDISRKLDSDTGVYIIGDEPTKEFLELRKEYNLDHVHFVGFKVKKDLAEYYAAADLFVLLSRGDVWGLVINEAMMYGLSVVTTPMCIAGTELVTDYQNGFIIPIDEFDILVKRIQLILDSKEMRSDFSKISLKKIKMYTTEKMAERHLKIMQQLMIKE